MAEPESSAERVYVVGPERVSTRWIFLCPACDADRLTTQPSQDDTVVLCTTEWLRGEHLRGDERVGDRSCYCFETDPYEGEGGAEINNKRRFFYYWTVSKLLGGGGKRVDLPPCVKEKIEELHGDSHTGFRAGDDEDA